MKNKKSSFTIVELIVAMAIFAILMLILMQIFSATQDVWRKTSTKSDTYDSVRQAIDMIATDLQSAIYVPQVGGETFYYSGNSSTPQILWFPTEKAYRIDNPKPPQMSVVEVKYEVSNYTSAENTAEGIPAGLTLKKLRYFIQTDETDKTSKNPATNWDYRSSTNAHTTMPTQEKGVVLDNILSFEVNALRKFGASYTSITTQNRFPHLVQIKVQVLDTDPLVRTKYINGDATVKESLTKTFNRFLFLDRGQVYID